MANDERRLHSDGKLQLLGPVAAGDASAWLFGQPQRGAAGLRSRCGGEFDL